MTPFRLFSKIETLFGSKGQLLGGGYLKFYDAGTTTPRTVYTDSGLVVPAGNTIDLDSSGRPNSDAWGDGSYFVEVYDADGVKQSEADNVQVPGAGGLAIPSLSANAFSYLTNDGSNLLWSIIRQAPDPTGQSGKIIGTDGTSLLWQSPPASPTPVATVADGKYVIGGGGSTNFMIQTGVDTAPASGSLTTSKSITFPTAYKAGTVPIVMAITVGATQPSMANVFPFMLAPATSTGATISFDVAEGNTADAFVISPVPFHWVSFGIVSA